VYLLSPEALVRRAPELVVVRGPRSRDAVALRGTAVEVWELLDSERPISHADLVATLATRHAVEPDVVARDIAPMWADLVAAGAIVDAAV
jgi:hypothetical protein